MSKSPPPKQRVGRDTNSNDAKALRRRVFIGNLNTDATTKDEVESTFAKFGEIESCSIHKNFGFIQYMIEKNADEAVTEMHGKMLFGKRIDVNLAGLRRKAQPKDRFDRPPDTNEVVPEEMKKYGKKPPRQRSRSPLRRRSVSPLSRYDEHRKRDPYERQEYYRSTYPQEPYGYAPFPRDPYLDPYAPRPYRPPPRPAIDCEIVCLSKEESRYAEDVESRLRSIGLVCNIGYPPAELATVELVDRIARCGTLYAVVVTSQNAQHRSCTLNILHGSRQEHRNMPLTDALSLIARNFDVYLRALREPPPPSYYTPPPRTYPARDYYAQSYGGGYSQTSPPSRPAIYENTDRKPEKELSADDISQMIAKLKDQKDPATNTSRDAYDANWRSTSSAPANVSDAYFNR